jgi:hypothetical protein
MKYQDKWKYQYLVSGFVNQTSVFGSGSIKQNNKKTLISSVLRLLCDFLSLKNDVNYLQ